jgi:hypothetical protein
LEGEIQGKGDDVLDLHVAFKQSDISRTRRPSSVDIDDGMVQVVKSLCQEGSIDMLLCIDVDRFTGRIYNISIDVNPNFVPTTSHQWHLKRIGFQLDPQCRLVFFQEQWAKAYFNFS